MSRHNIQCIEKRHLLYYPFPKQPLFLFVCVCSTNLLKKKKHKKGEIACNKQYLLFPRCFLPFWRTFCHFHRETTVDPFLQNFAKGLESQQRPTRKVFVYKIQVHPVHTILKYGDYYDYMDN